MQTRADLEKLTDALAKNPVEYGADTRAILVATQVLLDIRDQNEQIIELLQGVNRSIVGG